jgi:hypothetical protein
MLFLYEIRRYCAWQHNGGVLDDGPKVEVLAKITPRLAPDEDGEGRHSLESAIAVTSDDGDDKISAANQHLILIRENKKNLHRVDKDLTEEIERCPDRHLVVGDEVCADGGGQCQKHRHGEAVYVDIPGYFDPESRAEKILTQ